MAELKSTIKIEVDGIEKFLSTTKQVEKEILQIEKTLKKQGFKGNEKELKQTAHTYRKSMIDAVKDIQKAESIANKKKEADDAHRAGRMKRGFKSVGKITAGITVGGAAVEIIGTIIRAMSNVIDQNKEVNEGAGKIAGFIKQVGSVLSFVFLKVIGLLAPFVAVYSKILDMLGFANTQLSETQQAIKDTAQIINKAGEQQLKILAAQVDLQKKLLETTQETQDSQLIISDNLKSQLALLEDENLTLEEKIALYDTIQQDNSELLLTKADSLTTEEELNTAIKEGKQLSRDKLVLLQKEKLLAIEKLKYANKLTEIDEGQGILSKKRLSELQDEADILQSDIKSFSGTVLKLRTKFNADSKGDEAVLDGVKTGSTTLTIETIIKGQLDSLSELTGELVKDFYIQLGANELDDALHTIELMVTAQKELKDITDSQAQGKKTVLDMEKERLEVSRKLSAELTELTSGILYEVDILKGATVDGVFDAAKAEDVFKKTFDQAKGIYDNVIALKAKGFSSPTFKLLEVTIDEENAIEGEITKQKKIIEDAGFEAAKYTEISGEQIEKARKDLNDKRAVNLKAAEEAEIRALEQFKKMNLDKFTQRDEFILLEKKKNLEVSKLEEERQALQTQGLDAQTLVRLTELKNDEILKVEEKFKVDLDNLDKTSAKERFEAFKKQFAEESDQLEIQLKDKELDIKIAEQVLEDTKENFANRAIAENRDINEQEIDIINEQVDKIKNLEDDRFKQEEHLRFGAYAAKLDDLKQSGLDITELEAEYNLTSKKISFAHWLELQMIARKGIDSIGDETKKGWKDVASDVDGYVNATTDAFADVFNAYIAFQDAVAQAAIDKISKQLEYIDTELSETTSKIDSLESDLEGKRSGRRDALLRGIEIEKEREATLVAKKIELEEELRRAEKKAGDERKAAAIAQALINGAVAITGTWAGYASLGVAGAIIAAVQTAAIGVVTGFEIATIEKQQFADGGMLNGASHANGGIPFTIDGQPGFEAEGGEAIMSRRTVAMYGNELNQMQKSTGSKALFADGGSLPNFGAMSDALSGSQRRQIQSLSSQPLYVTVTDITNMQGRQARVTSVTNI